MPNHSVKCEGCGFAGEQIIPMVEVSDEWRSVCSECGRNELVRVYTKAPSLRMGGRSAEMSSLKRSCDQRFVKSGEMDQVRHKHGEAFDESLMAGAVKRAKSGEKNHWSKS